MNFEWVLPTLILVGFMVALFLPMLIVLLPNFNRYKAISEAMDLIAAGEQATRLEAKDGSLPYPVLLVRIDDGRAMQVYPDMPHQDEFPASLLLELREPGRDLRFEIHPPGRLPAGRMKGLAEIPPPPGARGTQLLEIHCESQAAFEEISGPLGQALDRLSRIKDGTPLSLSFNVERFQLRYQGELDTAEDIKTVVGTVKTLFETLAGSTPDAEPRICAACGASRREEALACRRCRTAYHPECWEAAGGCTVYPCPSVSAGPVPTALSA